MALADARAICPDLATRPADLAREAAALGVPAYSFFAGQWGGVDRYLQAQGRLAQLAQVEEVQRIRLVKRVRTPPAISYEALDFVMRYVERMVE